MKLSLVQKFLFSAIVFAIGCASSLWLESNQASTNPFFANGASYASPVSLPQASRELRDVVPAESAGASTEKAN
jgi:hypothetical protein